MYQVPRGTRVKKTRLSTHGFLARDSQSMAKGSSSSTAPRKCGGHDGFGIATVTRNPHRFDRWLAYYRALGAVRIFVAIEDTPAAVALCEAQPDLVIIAEGAATEANPYDSIIDRQSRHVDWALQHCASHQIGWLFHVDDDELLHFATPWPSIREQIAPNVDCVVISNMEAVPDHPHSDLTSISRFVADADCLLSYINGKSAGRVGSASACGCHRFSGDEWEVPIEQACILHFESCPYSRWRDKFAHYAKLQRRLSKIPFPFYLDSIQCHKQHMGVEAKLRAFWRRRKLRYYERPQVAPHVQLIEHMGLEKKQPVGPRPVGAAADVPCGASSRSSAAAAKAKPSRASKKVITKPSQMSQTCRRSNRQPLASL